jgi:hypothetical protein
MGSFQSYLSQLNCSLEQTTSDWQQLLESSRRSCRNTSRFR